ncbi:ABC transporter substrate-binding protein [Paenibacillus arenosi]|uniref:Extracellular solute-binding protein n=1 Tax=Paenibacillus arenosi TaxID=2774142 RepID=A0ABR9B1I0_9BACL|nr:extracellular solute-binding protein [Paenibacillus arenosi]MBD8500237.1 extracellular solute-binding protein [Paenibacillus arenosi]
MSSWTRPWKLVVVLSLVVSLLAACTGGNKSELPELPENGAGKITIMHYGEEQFMSEFGNTFSVKFPEIELEVVEMQEYFQSLKPEDDGNKKLIEFIKNKKVDVAMLNQGNYEELASAGVLYKLDTIIQDEKYSVDDFAPGVIDLIREKGGNALYGLPTVFNSQALFYNVDLFKKHAVELPTNKMNVKQVMDLAKRFDSKSKDEKDRIYGIHTGYRNIADYFIFLGEASNMQIIDQKAEKVVMDSEAWKVLFLDYAELVKSGKINMNDQSPNRAYDPGFAAGKSALGIGQQWMIEEMKYATQRYGPDGKPGKAFEWGMVTVPVDPASPDESSLVELSEIFAVTNDSPNKRAAWEFIKFSTGPEMARINGRSTRKLTARTKYQKEINGKSMEAFTMLRPAKNNYNVYKTLNKNDVSVEFHSTLTMKLNEALMAVKDGKKSAEQAYSDLLPELQKALEEAKQKGAKEKAEKK